MGELMNNAPLKQLRWDGLCPQNRVCCRTQHPQRGYYLTTFRNKTTFPSQ